MMFSFSEEICDLCGHSGDTYCHDAMLGDMAEDICPEYGLHRFVPPHGGE